MKINDQVLVLCNPVLTLHLSLGIHINVENRVFLYIKILFFFLPVKKKKSPELGSVYIKLPSQM